jgi:hypothetical protein
MSQTRLAAWRGRTPSQKAWIPAYAGMTAVAGMTAMRREQPTGHPAHSPERKGA